MESSRIQTDGANLYTPRQRDKAHHNDTRPSLLMLFAHQTHEADEAIDVHHTQQAQGDIDVQGPLASWSCE